MLRTLSPPERPEHTHYDISVSLHADKRQREHIAQAPQRLAASVKNYGGDEKFTDRESQKSLSVPPAFRSLRSPERYEVVLSSSSEAGDTELPASDSEPTGIA